MLEPQSNACGEREKVSGLRIGFDAVSGVLVLAGNACHRIHQRKDGEPALGLRHRQGLLGKITGNPVLAEHLGHVLRLVTQFGGKSLKS